MYLARKLVLAHFWVAFVAFLGAIVLGEWQMFVRSPLSGWVGDPEHYYRSVTGHGTVMGYVFPTLVAMGFGYAITELALKRPLLGLRWAWIGFGLTSRRTSCLRSSSGTWIWASPGSRPRPSPSRKCARSPGLRMCSWRISPWDLGRLGLPG